LTRPRADAMLLEMENVCDGCGKPAMRLRYFTSGAAVGRWLCLDCAGGRTRMTRLSRLVAFRFRVAEVLPPGDPTTAPAARLMMAVDDVRRAQILLVDAMERLDEPAERHRAGGDFLYAARLLFSHLHEAGHALRQLDAAARGDDGENRINGLLAGEDHREGRVALKACRRFFSAQGYWASLIPRVRNAIGSHYDERVVAELVKDEFTGDQLLESTAASVGGLARMADPVVRAIMTRLNSGDFMADESQTQRVSQALDVTGNLTTFVDYLFDALLRAHPDAIVEKDTRIVDVPPLIARAGEAVETARSRLRGERPRG